MSRTRRFVAGTATLIAGLGVLAAAHADAAPPPSDPPTTVDAPVEIPAQRCRGVDDRSADRRR